MQKERHTFLLLRQQMLWPGWGSAFVIEDAGRLGWLWGWAFSVMLVGVFFGILFWGWKFLVMKRNRLNLADVEVYYSVWFYLMFVRSWQICKKKWSLTLLLFILASVSCCYSVSACLSPLYLCLRSLSPSLKSCISLFTHMCIYFLKWQW